LPIADCRLEKMILHFILLLALAAGSPQPQQARIGKIDFFGKGLYVPS
jgi:hypothetical protein